MSTSQVIVKISESEYLQTATKRIYGVEQEMVALAIDVGFSEKKARKICKKIYSLLS